MLHILDSLHKNNSQIIQREYVMLIVVLLFAAFFAPLCHPIAANRFKLAEQQPVGR